MEYKEIKKLGAGAGSHVWLVEHADHGLCVMKNVLRMVDDDISYVDQLLNEYAVTRQLVINGQPIPLLRRALEMELVRNEARRVLEAETLLQYVGGEPLGRADLDEPDDTACMFWRLGCALRQMHKAGYVHCDLKPDNVLVTHESIPHLIDFGQACPVGTRKTRRQGTAEFIAPEQVTGFEITEATDVYAFGGTLYWHLTGHHLPTMMAHLAGEKVRPPRDRDTRCPKVLSDLTMECTRVGPSGRPTLDNVLEELEELFGR